MFFIWDKDHTEDDNNLLLSLPLSEGKGLNKEDMSALMKNEHYVPFKNVEFHEQARIMPIFIACFFSEGVTHKEIKLALDAIQKMEM